MGEAISSSTLDIGYPVRAGVAVDKVVSAMAGALAVLVALGVLDSRPRHDRLGCIAALSAVLSPELRNEVAAEKIRIVCREVEIR